MVDYLLDWLHNVMVTLATLGGIGLLGYVALRSLYPDTLRAIQQALHNASFWISSVNLWPLVALVVLFAVIVFTLPARRQRV